MKKIINLLLLFLLFFVSSCTKDFIVKDIKNSTIIINAPADSVKTPSNAITFWWEALDGAEKYNLQIVNPNFNSATQLLVDTNITTNKFNYTFTPGTYQWRIKAANAGGSTAYVTRTLIIDTTSNLAYASVGLISPMSNSVTSNNNIYFSWNPLYAANHYELTLTNTTTNSITTISNISGASCNVICPTLSGSEEKYSWQVKAFNSFSQTFNNTVRSFKIDRKSPSLPSLISPNSYSINIKDTAHLVWSRNSPDVIHDIIYISTDSTFGSFSASQTINTVAPTQINSIFSYTGTPTKYWWQVVSVDSVGNISLPSVSKRFYLK